MISKYTNKIRIKKDVYAVFNSLLMDPVFMNKQEYDDLFKGDLRKLKANNIKALHEMGILINNQNQDKLALDAIKENINLKTKEIINLMYIIPDNTCNLRCKYCFIGKLSDNKVEYMSKDTLRIALEKFSDHLNKIKAEKGMIVFYGGEPLINFEVIKYGILLSKEKKYNIEFSIVSNVTLLTPEIAQFIKDNNTSLGVSIDGPKDITDRYRVFEDNSKSVYDAVLEKFSVLEKLDVNFGLSITITDEFLENDGRFLDWLEGVNIKDISYNLMHYTSETDEWKSYYRKVGRFIFKSNQRLKKKGFSEDRVNRKYRSFYDKDFKYSDCGAIGGNQIAVRPNGEMTICHGYWNSEENEIGNIKDLKFENIFQKKIYKKWASNITINKKKCLSCPAIYICGGGCAMESKALFGGEEKIDRPFCLFTKGMLLSILTELYEENNR
jgi:uncharacterized protein